MNKRFREEILKRFKSEAALAKRMGWSRQKLHKVIHGGTSPKISRINELSRGMGIPVGELIELFEQQDKEG